MKVAVLGCGPAGLIAAHAVAAAGDEPVIFSRKKKSHLNGAQYLHAPIPGIETDGPEQITYEMIGSTFSYRLKVYGPLWDGAVSPEDLEENHDAWDIRQAYDLLWEQYKDAIVDSEVIPATIPSLANLGFETIVSSVPAPALCVHGHTFESTKVWAAGDAPELGIHIPYSCPVNTVICNGDEQPSWYRLSNVFGYKTVEWPGNLRSTPPVPTAQQVAKPTFNNCDCWPGVLRVGRYGTWRKGVLAHEAYWDVMEAILP